MRDACPARIERCQHGDKVVSFRDVPEALTGADTFEEVRAAWREDRNTGLHLTGAETA